MKMLKYILSKEELNKNVEIIMNDDNASINEKDLRALSIITTVWDYIDCTKEFFDSLRLEDVINARNMLYELREEDLENSRGCLALISVAQNFASMINGLGRNRKIQKEDLF